MIRRNRVRETGLLVGVAGCALAVLAAGLPASAEPGGQPQLSTDLLGLMDTSGMSPEEVIGLDPVDGADERRLLEESGDWHEDRPEVDDADPVGVSEIEATPSSEVLDLPEPVRSPRWGSAVVWPGSGSESVDLDKAAQARGRGAQVGKLPVWVRPGPGARGRLAVEVLDRKVVDRRGAAVGIELRPDAASAAARDGGTVSVTVDYTGFEHAYGGDYGSRLRAVAYDASCFDSDACEGALVESVNDPEAGTVTAEVPATIGGTVVLLSAGESGPAGDWSATSLSPSGEWSHGGSSGDFSWSYPMRTPDMPGGLGPDLSLSYSAQSVDGRTTSTNNQTSWIGEGWSGLEPGFVERRYVACADDMGSGANNSTKTGDLCWKTENATLSLGGSSSELVKDSSSGQWRAKNDDGTRVERLTGAANGARNGEYWKVTTTDGVQYFFGQHKRYAADTAATNSVLTVPVAGNHAGEPCHASAFKDSFCTQAYRWNLDYVVDPNGNTMTYFYTRESNRYGQNLNDASASYHRGSYLRRVEYGQRKGSEHETPAPARVVFTTEERCLTDCDELKESTAKNWPDVPYDQICTSTSSCKDSQVSPSFFSRKRVTQVETQVRVSGSYQAVDRWALRQQFPDPGDGNSAALWLARITHTGVAGTAVTLPPVRFYGLQMHNRVDEIDGASPLIKYRVGAIESETGAVSTVRYSARDCQPGGTIPSPHTNSKRCFPVYWKHEGSGADDPRVHWFHKYVTDAIIETDTTGDGVDVEHHYTYHGSPAWAYNDDEFTKSDYRTWGLWRGYGKVTTRTGNPDGAQPQLRTERLYLRGMHGDRSSPTGGTRSVSVTDSWGDEVVDREEWAGFVREEIVYDGSSKVTSTVNDPWRSSVTADDGTTKARMTNTAATREHTKLSSGWRTTEIEYSYDSHGLVTQVNDRGDISTTSDDLCVRTEYAKNTTLWILETVKRSATVSKRCSATPSRPADVVSDERYFYDGGSYGAAPSKGNVTRTEVLDDWSGGPQYVATSRMSYDSHGRVTSAKDALGRETTTAYTPATGGPVTKTVETNPAGHTTTTTLDARRGAPTRVTDANGKRTDVEYDGLGRLTKVWLTDRDKASQSPSMEYSYRVAADKPVAVTSRSLLPSGDYATSVELLDSLLRPRQSQVPAAGDHGGRLVTLSEYDSRGLVVEAKGPFYASGSPSTTLVEPAESVERRILTEFDGAGRVVVERLVVHHAEHSRRTTTYGGDRVRVTPPEGGTATTTISDARGRTVELRHHHGGSPSGSFDALSYTWTAAGELETAVDAAGNTWSYGYDLRGRRVRTDDPDAGVSTAVFDVAGQVVSTTDARGETLSYTYDALGRKTHTRDGDGVVVAEWVFDTLELGQLSSSTRFVDGDAYRVSVYGYDDGYRSLGETVTVPDGEGVLAGSYTSYRGYYPDGSPYVMTEPAVAGLPAETLRTRYNAAGDPEWMYGRRTYVADTVYSPLGLVEQFSLGVNIGRENWQTFGYEEGTRRLASVRVDRAGVDPADSDVAYSYDPAGNPTQIADTGGTGSADVQCFTYDYSRRVTGAWSQTGTGCADGPDAAVLGGPAPYGQSYTYDAAGNRASLTDHIDEVTTTYQYPAAGESGPHAVSTTITDGQSTSYAYDASGNTTEMTGPDGATSTYGWDEQGRLDTAETAEGVSEFVYSADGDRLLRKEPGATTLYVFGTEITVDHTTGVVSGLRYYSFAGQVLAMRDGDELYTLGADLWGTPTTVIDNTSMAITKRRSDPFGNPRDPQPITTWPGDRGFHTGTNDPATGLVHMGARPYDPALGRFLAVDPLIDLTDPDQINGYAYANNNPLTYTDPSGLMYVECDGGCNTGGGYGRTANVNNTTGTTTISGKKPTNTSTKRSATANLNNQTKGTSTSCYTRGTCGQSTSNRSPYPVSPYNSRGLTPNDVAQGSGFLVGVGLALTRGFTDARANASKLFGSDDPKKRSRGAKQFNAIKKRPWISTLGEFGKKAWVKNLGRASVVGGFGLSTAGYLSDGDDVAVAATKAGFETATAAAGAAVGALAGGFCGPLAVVCSPAGAAVGGVVGGLIGEKITANYRPNILGWKPFGRRKRRRRTLTPPGRVACRLRLVAGVGSGA